MGLCLLSCKKPEDYENESDQEYKERIRSHYVSYYTVFMASVSFSAILPGLWPYLNKLDPTAEKSFYGYLMAGNAFLQIFICPLVGKWSNKINSVKIPFRTCVIFLLISQILYANLENFSTNRKYIFLLSRVLGGVGGASIALTRSHISTSTRIDERRKAVSFLASCGIIAFAIGPTLQYIVVPLGEEGFWLFGTIKLDMYSGLGWILVILTLINVILFHPCVFKEYNMLKKEENSSENRLYPTKHFKFLACTYILMDFITTFNFMITKTINTPLAMEEFAMSRKDAIVLTSNLLTGCAIASFLTIMSLTSLSKFLSEKKVFILGVVFSALARIFFYPWNNETHIIYDNLNVTCMDCEQIGCPLSQNWCMLDQKVFLYQMILANLFENIGNALSSTMVVTIFSKVLGTKQQGTWMGFLTSSSALARGTSPIATTQLYVNFGPSIISITGFLFFVITMFILIRISKCLIVRKDEDDGIEMVDQNKQILDKNLNNAFDHFSDPLLHPDAFVERKPSAEIVNFDKITNGSSNTI